MGPGRHAPGPAAVRPASAGQQDPRWAAIRRVFGQEGETGEGYFRVNLPRSDLRVRIGQDALDPRFEFTSYVGFAPVGTGDVLAMGEAILLQEEVTAAVGEALRQGVEVPALHNHLIGETPRIVYMHVRARGPAEAVARELHAVFERTGTPMRPVALASDPPAQGGWAAVDSILGKHSEAEGSVAEYEFRRREQIVEGNVPVKSSGMLETGSEVVFQRLPAGRVANTGELFLLPSEIGPVARELETHGLHVTAIHNHMVEETPRMYWMHWYATGDAATLARGVQAALARTNSERRAAPGG
jgi:hypothetical protein